MSGFMSSTTAITICKVNSTVNFTLDALRAQAFTPNIDADGRRLGWVALGDPLDTDGFELVAIPAFPSGWIPARLPGPLSGSSLPKPFGRKSPPASRLEASAEKN